MPGELPLARMELEALLCRLPAAILQLLHASTMALCQAHSHTCRRPLATHLLSNLQGSHPFADVVAHHVSVLGQLLAEEGLDGGLVDDDCGKQGRSQKR